MASRSLTSRRARRRREGNVAILTALMLAMMMGFVALSFDIGNVYRVRTENQRAVDSAALAGAAGLDGTSAGITVATAQAVTFGNLHFAYTEKVALTDGDVVPGIWNFTNNKFTENRKDFDKINAIQVTYKVESVSLPFAAVLGKSSTTVLAAAIAVGGGPADNACTFPMVIPDCAVADAATNDTCSMCLKMGSATVDNVAWTSFGQGNGNSPNDISAAIELACFANGVPVIDANGECPQACGTPTQMNGGIEVNGGDFFNQKSSKQNPSPCEVIAQIINRDGSPKPFTVKVPTIATGLEPKDCGRAKLAGNGNTIGGYTVVDIYEVNCGKNKLSAKAPLPFPEPDCGKMAADKYLKVALHRDPKTNKCDSHAINDHAGGPFNGAFAEPRLVQ